MGNRELDSCIELELRLGWLEEALSVHCDERSWRTIAAAVQNIIEDVRENNLDLIEPENCASAGLPPSEESKNYSDIQALYIALTTKQYLSDLNSVITNPRGKRKRPPASIFAAYGRRKVVEARKALATGNLQKAELLFDDIKYLADSAAVNVVTKYRFMLTAGDEPSYTHAVRRYARLHPKRRAREKEKWQPMREFFDRVKDHLISNGFAYHDIDIVKIACAAVRDLESGTQVRRKTKELPPLHQKALAGLARKFIETCPEYDEGRLFKILRLHTTRITPN
tara:strand:- start:2632 stop:3477 length:846 start_codon:yes stop_codon:yes gene_type:complete